MQNRNHRTAFAMPLPDKAQQIGGGFRIHRIEGLIQQQNFGILYQKPREKQTLQLPAACKP